MARAAVVGWVHRRSVRAWRACEGPFGVAGATAGGARLASRLDGAPVDKVELGPRLRGGAFPCTERREHVDEGERVGLRRGEAAARLVGLVALVGRADEGGSLGGEHGDQREHLARAVVLPRRREQRLGVGGLERQLGHEPAVVGERAAGVERAEREELLERRDEAGARRRRDKLKREHVVDPKRLRSRTRHARDTST
jgi:hypothetical protein